MLSSGLNELSWTASTSEVTLTAHEALSGIFASISLSSWIFFLVPQLLENRRNQSGEAVSLSFILIRFASDIFNLLGALLAQIIPGAVAVAWEYCISDVLLIAQILYYGIRNRRREGKTPLAATIETFKGNMKPENSKSSEVARYDTPQYSNSSTVRDGNSESSPLLAQRTCRTHSYDSDPPKHHHTLENPIDRLTEMLDEGGSQSTTQIWLKDLGFILAVCVIAIIGWALAYRFRLWTPQPEETKVSSNKPPELVTTTGEVLGYASAALSLCCRIPQIFKNWRYKSCEGLSLLFFILSLIGNLTEGASILFHSTQKAYLIKNAPWLIGTLGTIAQDVIIFVQFHMYREPRKSSQSL